MAKVLALVGYDHFEADMFFTVDGTYCYDASRIEQAHAWCQDRTCRAQSAGRRVVVSNTFTRLHEMEPYRAMTGNIRILEARGNWANEHGVPQEIPQRMAQRWEHLPAQR